MSVYKMDKYPQITLLRQRLISSRLRITDIGASDIGHAYKSVTLQFPDETYKTAIYDEMEDLNANNQLMAFYLLLSELEEYNDSEDFLTWSKGLMIPAANDAAQAHYSDLRTLYPELRRRLRVLDPVISDFDYQLNTGVMQALRNVQG